MSTNTNIKKFIIILTALIKNYYFWKYLKESVIFKLTNFIKYKLKIRNL